MDLPDALNWHTDTKSAIGNSLYSRLNQSTARDVFLNLKAAKPFDTNCCCAKFYVTKQNEINEIVALQTTVYSVMKLY